MVDNGTERTSNYTVNSFRLTVGLRMIGCAHLQLASQTVKYLLEKRSCKSGIAVSNLQTITLKMCEEKKKKKKKKKKKTRRKSRKSSSYAQTLNWIRCRLSFALLRSGILCLRGARTVRPANSASELRQPDLAVVKARLE